MACSSSSSSSVWVWAILVSLFRVSLCSGAKPKTRYGLETSPLTDIQALEGKKVVLPCNITPPLASDHTILILFYRADLNTPIYSIDGRNSPIRRAQHWHDPSILGHRAYFDLTSDPQGLALHPVSKMDSNEYRCRVDFRSSPTRNMRVKLNVIVPPKKLRMLSKDGEVVSGLIGPYGIGSSLSLTCTVYGGQPTPIVSWHSKNILLDNELESTTNNNNNNNNNNNSENGEIATNTLSLHSLSRLDLYRVFTCEAYNSNLSLPLVASVTLDLSFPPLDVRILSTEEEEEEEEEESLPPTPPHTYIEGQQYKLVCESRGSRPAAALTWWRDGMLMTDARSQVLQAGAITRSALFLTPSAADHDKYISCRAQNPLLPTQVVEDLTKLNIYYTPRLSLSPGQSINLQDIKEGDDVYFDCRVRANPSVFKVHWFHNGEEMEQNLTAGIILSHQSLVLQKVTQASSGQYACAAANVRGHSASNAMQLSVRFAPVCKTRQRMVYGAAKNEEINVTCPVEANPEPTAFRWAFNSSSILKDLLTTKWGQVRSAGHGRGQQQVTYTPLQHEGYGTILCFAVNEVGIQKIPCVFDVVHAAPPEPVKNCTIENLTSSSVTVRCEEGWGGDLNQDFTLSITPEENPTAQDFTLKKKNPAPRVLAKKSTASQPTFHLQDLQPGTQYELSILSLNKKGQSQPVKLVIVTLTDVAERQRGADVPSLALTSILGVVLGVGSSFIIILVVVVRMKQRGRNWSLEEMKVSQENSKTSSKNIHNNKKNSNNKKNNSHNRNKSNNNQDNQHTTNPDLIPMVDPDDTHTHTHQQRGCDYIAPSTTTPTATVTIHEGSGCARNDGPGGQDYYYHQVNSFYINPGSLIRQEPQECRNQFTGPIAASTPHGTTPSTPPPPPIPSHYPPTPPPYTSDLSQSYSSYILSLGQKGGVISVPPSCQIPTPSLEDTAFYQISNPCTMEPPACQILTPSHRISTPTTDNNSPANYNTLIPTHQISTPCYQISTPQSQEHEESVV